VVEVVCINLQPLACDRLEHGQRSGRQFPREVNSVTKFACDYFTEPSHWSLENTTYLKQDEKCDNMSRQLLSSDGRLMIVRLPNAEAIDGGV
jgi:hypothetical protein